MLQDRRRSPRVQANRLARIQTGADTAPRDWRVSDISDDGVRLFLEDADVPDEFVLFLDGGGRHNCRVVWRLGPELGAEFVRHDASAARIATLAQISTAPAQAHAASEEPQPAVPLRVVPGVWRR